MLIDLNLIFLVVVVILIVSLTIYGLYIWRRGNYQPTQSSQPKDASTPIYRSETDTGPNKIILGNINDPWGEIARYPKTEIDNYEEIQLNEKTLIGFSSWFQQVPNLAQSGAQMMLNTYTLTFKPEIAKGIADGSLKIMESLDRGIRAVAVDSNNIMRGVGSLNPATGMQSLASVMVVWQVLAMVTAQKFLADINKQLVKINTVLGDIKNFLQNEQYTKLVGNLEYIQVIQDTLGSQSFDNDKFGDFLNQLEAIERECTQIMLNLELQMATVYANFERQPLKAKINVKENFIASSQLITDYQRLERGYLVAVAVRCLASQTRCAIPSNRNVTLRRLSTLQDKIYTWNENRRNFYQLVSERLPELTSLFDDGKEKRRQIRKEMYPRKNSLAQMGEDIQKLVLETENNIRNQIQENSQPLSLLVELNEDGQIIKTWKLRNENNKPVEIFEKEIVLSGKVIEDELLEKELNKNNLCPECGVPFKTPELVQEHRERWEH